MKLPALLLAASLACNAVLVAAFFTWPTLAPPAFRDYFTTDAARAAQAADERHAIRARAAASAKAVAATRSRLWAALASDDLPTLVARLRAAGFSPTVIRGIINAQLDRWFRTRMKELAGDAADAPFWKTETSGYFSNPKLDEARAQVYRERTQKLRALLGDDFFASSGGDPTATQRRQFGNISPAKIDLVRRINDDYAEMSAQVVSAAQGIILPEDREKLALLQRERRADLAAILAPDELEDYLMRSSPITSRLRSALSLMDATEAEFRTIYQIYLPFSDVLFPPSAGGITYASGGSYNLRREAQTTVAEQAKASLGETRFADFVRASSFEFQQLQRLAQRDNLPAEAAISAFNSRDAAARESMRIMENRSLNTEQKRAALQILAQNTTTQLVTALGPTAGNAYVKSATWLNTIANGGAVSFGLDGSSTTYRTLPPPGTKSSDIRPPP